MISLTKKQRAVIGYLQGHEQITLDECIDLLGSYYCNTRKHTGVVMARLVKRGLIKRIKPGVYALAPKDAVMPEADMSGTLFAHETALAALLDS